MVLEQVVANLVQKVEHRFYGKYRGFVVDNQDPQHLGRLKLRVPSVLGNQVVTGWAMPCLPYGGDANQGFLFIPQVSAGVWVEFEEGDLEFPIWVGTFWSKPGGESELPKPNNSEDGAEQDSVQHPPTRKIIKTVKGHTIQLEDKDGEEMIIVSQVIDAEKRNTVTMNKEGLKITSQNSDAGKEKQHVITMDKDGIMITEGINGHAVTMSKDGVQITDGTNGHAITLARDGVQVQDGVNKHEANLTAQGISVKDGVNQHQIALKSTGVSVQTATGAKVELMAAQTTVDAGTGIVVVKGSLVQLGPGAMPVLRVGDQGVGNLGAPVPITITTNTQVLA